MQLLPFNKAIKILLVTNSMVLMAGAMLGPIYALFVKDVGGDLLDASIAGAIFAFFAGITTLISGRYSDKIKENELIIVLGYVIMGIGFLLYIGVHSIYYLFFVQALIGIGEAVYSPAFDAVYSKHLDKKKEGIQWGAWESMYYFTAAIGAFVGGILVTLLGFNFLFVVMSLLCFSSAIYIYHLNRKVL